MKTILRITVILLVASVVAGAFSLAVNNIFTSSTTNESGQPAATTQNFQPMERPDGGNHEEASIAAGLGGLFATLVKLSGLVLLVLGLQKGFGLVRNSQRTLVQR